jgi:hypothetical protein
MVSRPDDPARFSMREAVRSANDRIRAGVPPHCNPNGGGIVSAAAEAVAVKQKASNQPDLKLSGMVAQ